MHRPKLLKVELQERIYIYIYIYKERERERERVITYSRRECERNSKII